MADPPAAEPTCEEMRLLLSSVRKSLLRISTRNGFNNGHPADVNERWTEVRSALVDLTGVVDMLVAREERRNADR